MSHPEYPPERILGLRRGGPGRPAGQAGLARRIRKAFGDDGARLVDGVVRLLDDLNMPGAVRLSAATWLRDAGYGKPPPRRTVADAIGRELVQRFGSNGEKLAARIEALLRDEDGVPEIVARRLAEEILDP